MRYTGRHDDDFNVHGYLGDPLGDRVVEHLGVDVNVNLQSHSDAAQYIS